MRPVYYPVAEHPEVRFTCTLNKHAPDSESFAIEPGVAVRYTDTKAVVLPWPNLVNHLRVLLEHCPQAREDVRAALNDVVG